MFKETKNKSPFKILLFLVLAIIFIVTALLGGYWFGKKTKTLSFQAKFGDIGSQVKYSSEVKEVFSVIGSVKQTGNNVLTIDARETASGFLDMEKSKLKELQIKINPDTKFIRIMSLPNGDENLEEINFSDLKQGQMIKVFSNENIRGKNEFNASKIYLIQ